MLQQQELVNNITNLKRYAVHLTGNREDAEDLVQATTLRALEKSHLFQDGTNLLSWESKIMFNLFVTDYRRKARFESKCDPESIIEVQSVKATQEENYELSRVRKAVQSLSPDHRKILIMVCVYGIKYEEVSRRLSIPLGTVRSRVARARENLISILDNSQDNSRAGLKKINR